MGRSFCERLALAIVMLMLHPLASGAQSSGESTDVVVAVVEPRTAEPGSDQIGYSVTLGKSKLETLDCLLRGLAQAKAKRLAILVHEDVPVGTTLTIVSLASKVGFLDYALIIFDGKRRGMTAVPGFKWVEFSTDPEVVSGLLR